MKLEIQKIINYVIAYKGPGSTITHPYIIPEFTHMVIVGNYYQIKGKMMAQ